MKKSILLSLLILGAATSTQAASMFLGNVDRGFVLADGTTAMSSGLIRLGTFAAGTNFASDVATLETAFTEVLTSTGPWTFGGNPGFFEFTGAENAPLTFTGGSTLYEGKQYDLTTGGIDLTNASDIVGEQVYMWVMNNTTPGSATQHAILRDGGIWTDAQSPDPSVFFDTVSPTLSVGSLSSATLTGGTAPAIQLSNIAAIPEPSRAMLGFIGLAAMVFRRRRA